jgi:DNA-directed RNA polymerase I subunit RPA1
MSVCRITNPVTFDQFNHPTTNGLYDRSMGPTEFNVNCGSCFLNMNECPGHIGHIELSVPLYNPTLFPLLFRLLRLKCYACHRFRAPQRMSQILKAKLMLLDCGRIVDVLELDDRLRAAGAAAAAAVSSLSTSSMTSSVTKKKKSASKKPAKKQGKKKKSSKRSKLDDEDVDDNDEEMEDVDEEEDEEEEEEDDRPDPKENAQTVADAINDEINRYLRDVEIDCIAQCGADVGCGLRSNVATQYSQHVRECRASLVNEFLKSFPPKCGNCSAVALSLRKDGFSKIFQVPLTPTAAVAMAAKGIKYKSAAGVLRIRELREKARRNRVDREAKGKEDDDENDAHLASLEAEMEEGAADLMTAVVADDEDVVEEDEEDDDEEGDVSKTSKKKGGQAKPNFMPASEVAAQMQLLWEHEAEIVRRVFFPVSNNGSLLRNKVRFSDIRSNVLQSNSTAVRQNPAGGWRFFFLRVLPVAPPRFRPPTRLGDAQFEHPQNVYLTKVLKLNYELVDLGLGGASSEGDASSAAKSAPGDVTGGVDMRKALTVWMNLQNTVNGLIDSGKMQTQSGTEAAPGIKQLLEKKEGMFRKYMMGKRVNFAARTVISPDPFLRVDQVGVPLRFAKGLTFKQPVTAWNSAEMRRLVINGPNVWPGATHVEESSGAIIDLSTKSLQQREAMAKKLLLTSGAASAGFDGSATSGFIPTSGPIISSSTLSTQLLQPIDLDPAQGAAAAASGSLPGVGVTRVWRHLQDNDIVLMNRQVSLTPKPLYIMTCFSSIFTHYSFRLLDAIVVYQLL